MVLTALRLFRSLSLYQYRTIILTVLLPAIGSSIIVDSAPDLFLPQPALHMATFLVWSALAVLAVASMLKRDRSDAGQLVDQRLEALSAQIKRLREEHQGSSLDLRQQVSDLEEVVRSTLSEEMGVLLPARSVSIRATMTAVTPTLSASLTVVSGSKLDRLRQRVRRALRQSWDALYGKPEDH